MWKKSTANKITRNGKPKKLIGSRQTVLGYIINVLFRSAALQHFFQNHTVVTGGIAATNSPWTPKSSFPIDHHNKRDI